MEEDERRPKTTASVEILRSQIKAGSPALYTAYKMLSGMGTIISPILLSVGGYLYNSIHSEWTEMKTQVQEIRREVDRLPTSEELESLRQKVEVLDIKTLSSDPGVREKLEDLSDRVMDLNERTILVESVCCDSLPITKRAHHR